MGPLSISEQYISIQTKVDPPSGIFGLIYGVGQNGSVCSIIWLLGIKEKRKEKEMIMMKYGLDFFLSFFFFFFFLNFPIVTFSIKSNLRKVLRRDSQQMKLNMHVASAHHILFFFISLIYCSLLRIYIKFDNEKNTLIETINCMFRFQRTHSQETYFTQVVYALWARICHSRGTSRSSGISRYEWKTQVPI